MNNIGRLGEEIIAKWLEQQNHQIIAQRWRCREGEIDLIALKEKTNTLIFVEVKTRNLRNWDENGLLAINEQKQAKILLTAETFLSKNPDYSQYNCRFDLALLNYQHTAIKEENNTLIIPQKLNSSILYQNYEIMIKNYLKNIID